MSLKYVRKFVSPENVLTVEDLKGTLLLTDQLNSAAYVTQLHYHFTNNTRAPYLNHTAMLRGCYRKYRDQRLNTIAVECTLH